MFSLKKKYFIIIENIRDINLGKIKKRDKFIIIYRNLKKTQKNKELVNFRRECLSKNIKFFVANNIKLAIDLKSDGIYLSSNNQSLRVLSFKKKNFNVIGSAHNIKEIQLKKQQGCKIILLSRLFKVSYKPTMSFLEINRFNYFTKICRNIIPLGGINLRNLNKLKIIKSDAFAVMSEIKKKAG